MTTTPRTDAASPPCECGACMRVRLSKVTEQRDRLLASLINEHQIVHVTYKSISGSECQICNLIREIDKVPDPVHCKYDGAKTYHEATPQERIHSIAEACVLLAAKV